MNPGAIAIIIVILFFGSWLVHSEKWWDAYIATLWFVFGLASLTSIYFFVNKLFL